MDIETAIRCLAAMIDQKEDIASTPSLRVQELELEVALLRTYTALAKKKIAQLDKKLAEEA